MVHSVSSQETPRMCERAIKNIDDVLWKEAGCTTELDYTEQTSWLLFLKYLAFQRSGMGRRAVGTGAVQEVRLSAVPMHKGASDHKTMSNLRKDTMRMYGRSVPDLRPKSLRV